MLPKLGPVRSVAEVTVPNDEIDKEGIELIKGLVGRVEIPEKWSWRWHVPRDPEYVGTLPKRLGKLAYKQNKKLTTAELAEIGNIGASHSLSSSKYYVRFVKKFDWNAGDYGDNRSCFWSCHAGAKDLMKDNGGRAILFYEKKDVDFKNHQWGIGRAWMLPVKDWGYTIFNQYGRYSLLEIAKVVSHHLNLSYKKIRHDSTDENDVLYLNNGGAYLVAKNKNMHEKNINRHTYPYDTDGYKMCFCGACDYQLGISKKIGDMANNVDKRYSYCKKCLKSHTKRCSVCKETNTSRDNYVKCFEGICCRDCRNKKTKFCYGCGEYVKIEDCTKSSYNTCKKCAAKSKKKAV